ncbi:MAG: riboflavin synthase [Rubrimonas sp.]|uniref:riboflavin synthase n=1 Tax=Rubrimonas sp. TaxID=2036015 RepID=UPI002FDEF2B5
MFTGIITDVGEIGFLERRGDLRARILCRYPADGIALGASIACDGVCLTVVDRGAEGGRAWFDVDASAETLSKTTLGDWTTGRRVNLERALKVGDELGGHIVSGHVDGVGVVIETRPEGDSLRVSFEAPPVLAPFIAPKGSIAVDGASLTVNEVEGARFGVNLIPHTRAWTTFDALTRGRRVNLEIDVLARYVARLRETMADG